MLGLRTQEEPKFLQFFSLVQTQAALLDAVFFLDCGEGRELETEQLSGEDLSGWLVPKDQADLFAVEFAAGNVSDHWDSFICFAIWKEAEEGICITFQTY